jgi:tRNA pseudouridine38-40 synthase
VGIPESNQRIQRKNVSHCGRDFAILQLTERGLFLISSCDTRVYEYLFPSYILLPPTPGSLLDKHLESARTAAGVEQEPLHSFWKEVAETTRDMVAPTPAVGEEAEDVEILKRRKITVMKRGWRCGSEELERFREVVQKYLGTQ